MAEEELSAGPAVHNYKPLYFCGDASLSNQAVGMKRHISFIFSFILSKHSLQAQGRAQAHHNVSLLCLSTAVVRSTKIPEIAFLLHLWRIV